jgi:hypothetical protein
MSAGESVSPAGTQFVSAALGRLAFQRLGPLLVLEDVSVCHRPPPWNAGHADAVRPAWREIAAHPVPPGLHRAVDTDMVHGGWPDVARDPEPLLSLERCRPRRPISVSANQR